MSQGVEDLFGNKLAGESAQEFEDGIYRIKGVSMKKGVYRAGRWEGRPFARFMYELETPDGNTQQVSQMLPWLPGKAFFEINFKLLTGMSLSDFTQHCRSQGFEDAAAQSRFFLERFRGVEYEAEVRRKDRWYNVWEIRRRIDPGEDAPNPGVEESEQAPEGAAALGPDSQSGKELQVLRQLAEDRQLGEADLEEISSRLFSLGLTELSSDQIDTLQREIEGGPEPEKPGPSSDQATS